MVGAMLVIRKIVDRTSYNRANIIDPILAYPRYHLPTCLSLILPCLRLHHIPNVPLAPPSNLRRLVRSSFSDTESEDLKEISLGSFIFQDDASA